MELLEENKESKLKRMSPLLESLKEKESKLIRMSASLELFEENKESKLIQMLAGRQTIGSQLQRSQAA